MKLSIIIPCYNVANYIERCVDGLLNLSLDDYEIIIVDDGSTDNLLVVCKKWEGDARIKVVHTENQGVSEARNTGLRIARGEYVWFMDGDDWVDAEVFGEALKTCMKMRVDGLRIGYRLVDDKGKEVKDRELELRDESLELRDESLELKDESRGLRDEGLALRVEGRTIDTCVEGEELLPLYIGFRRKELKRVWRKDFKDNKRLSFVWSFIFRRQILKDNDIWFEKGLQFMEDKLFLCEFLCYAKKIVKFDKVCYNYFVHSDGLRRTNFADRINHAEQRVMAEKCRERMMERVKKNTGIILEPMYQGTTILAAAQLLLNCFRGPFCKQFTYFKEYMRIGSVRRAFGID